MAAKISLGGNFNTAASWAVVDATSLLDSEAGNTELTTSYVESATFTPGAITIDGIAVKLASRAASPTGTVSIRLALGGATVAGTEVTINATDLPTCGATANEGGWILFKFASPVTLAAATAYTVSGKESVATADVFLYRNATAGNWSRMLRTTTTGVPAAGDQLDIMGEHTGAGTGNNITITMDQISSSIVDLGSGSDGAAAMTVCKRGTINFAYSAATNYYLKCSGNCIVYNGGTMTIGTVANPIPRDSTAVLEFDPVADGGMGLNVRNGATFTAQGLSRTTGKNIFSCKLNTDEAINQTALGVDTDTGWLDNDKIAIASTTQTYSQCETGLLNGNAGASSLTVDGFGGAGGGLAYAHSGTSPTQAEVILLTRNVKIRSTSSTIMSYCYFATTPTVDIDWVEFYYLGENVYPKNGVETASTTGSFNMSYCSLWGFEDGGFSASGASGTSVNFSYNVLYGCCSATATGCIKTTASSGSNTITYNIVMLSAVASAIGFSLFDLGSTYTNNVSCGINGKGYQLSETGAARLATFSDNVAHSNAGNGFSQTSVSLIGGTITNLTCWRNSLYGIYFSSPLIRSITFESAILFGNATANIYINSYVHNVTFNNSIFAGDSSFGTTNGISWQASSVTLFSPIFFNSCIFGSTGSGIYVNHSSNDINIASTDSYSVDTRIFLNNCKLSSGTEVANSTILSEASFVSSQKHDQVAGAHKIWKRYGIIQTDATYYNTASPSERLTPNSASYKLESGSKKVAVASGQTVTINAYVRKSTVASGGALYNGNQPRLILKRNDAIGITADTVIDTMTEGATANWEQLTGTTGAASDDGVMEFLIDCDGTAGFVNVDDWTVS